jgi:two-component sensor histidine kinase/HAMP domain-containing protein
MARGIYKQGLATVRYFIISILGIGLLFGIITLFLLEKSVLSRLTYLSSNVSRIGKSKDPSERVSMSGDDELMDLAKDINSMLRSFEQSQKELFRSETKNRALLEAIPDIIFQIRKDGTIFNYKATKNENLYMSPNIFLGRRLNEILPKDVAIQAMDNIEKAIQTQKTQTFRYQLEIQGEVKDYEARIAVTGEDEIIAIVTDISEHKKAEEARKNELLLKEIHHRIKNNLQVISSLLYLQSKDIKDKKVLEMFKESQHRVKSMALAHEKLYQSKEMARIEFGEYIRDLTQYLFQTYRINSNVIKLHLDVEHVYINMYTAIPCGLIVNELITNSLKHAFPDGRTGEIKISFHSENAKLSLSVSDDGIGIPEKLDFRNTESLGLKLVTALIEQIDGTIELDTKNGTKFNMIFTELKNGEVL